MITIGRTAYTIKGELSEGTYYLEGPRGGAMLAKLNQQFGLYTFHDFQGRVQKSAGVPITATIKEIQGA